MRLSELHAEDGRAFECIHTIALTPAGGAVLIDGDYDLGDRVRLASMGLIELAGYIPRPHFRAVIL